ncbi:MAG: hypothetical protein CMP91_07705 [Gammaproteobacteria bacterium]|nr:hypothetical protein [Gammaproteobacteria bacterium]MAY03498.1 hypothetical protein [Gammaproteobacteria bacterium]
MNFATYVHNRLSFFLKTALVIGAISTFWQAQYQSTFEILLILLITTLPVVLGNRFDVRIPHIFETFAVIFVFMSLFLGEVYDYYGRFWWWDKVLHTGSAFLLGVLGFLLVYVLNEKKEIELELNPSFMALFAFMFAVSIGAIWEIFEFTMDQIFGLNMQKSGLVDTMWDLIVDCLGAMVVSVFGWIYIKDRENDSFLERWIEDFIEKNPKLFQHGSEAEHEKPGSD